MTRDQASLMMPFMVAYIGGADIQVYADNEWRDCEPYFNPNVMYRIKPKERSVWINIYTGKSINHAVYTTHKQAIRAVGPDIERGAVEFREVME